jgi:hypothetical protein
MRRSGAFRVTRGNLLHGAIAAAAKKAARAEGSLVDGVRMAEKQGAFMSLYEYSR